MLTQLIYYSHLADNKNASINLVRNILEVSEANNVRDRLTGFLIFDKTNFLQILEGNKADIERTYRRICADERHGTIVLIDRREIQSRDFKDWAMGGYVRTSETQPIYARHGIEGQVNPEALKADQVITLAQDLLRFEAERQSLRGLSSRT
ncbi:MAG: BLUF domain-containing protein [Asticcacaulis sp.]